MPEEAIVTSIFFGVFVFVVFAVIIAIAVRRVKAQMDRQREMDDYKRTSQVEIDGNGRTQHQRDFLNQLRAKQAERKVKEIEVHSHKGKEERYDRIVGSLGEVNDEGCDELDGVRLLEHDEAYCDEPAHFEVNDYNELQQAIVIGEVVNSPRFKRPYGKR